MIFLRALVFGFLIAGCVQAANGDAAAPAVPPPAAPPAQQPEEPTIEEFLQRLSTVPGVIGRKDPFAKAEAPYVAFLPKTDLPESDLERYDLKDYTITAVLMGDVYNRALVGMPNKKVMIVREKDRLGNRGGVIMAINREGVVVQQIHRSYRGAVDKTVITLPVGGVKK